MSMTHQLTYSMISSSSSSSSSTLLAPSNFNHRISAFVCDGEMQLINGFDRELYSLADAGTTKHLPLTTFHFTSMFLFSRRIRVQRQWVIKEAIKAARTEVGLTNRFPLETPATPERLVLTSSVCKLRFLP